LYGKAISKIAGSTKLRWLGIKTTGYFKPFKFCRPNVLNIGQALGWGSLFGFIIAGSVNLVNYSLINNWSGKLATVDTLLSTVMIGLSSGLLFWLGSLF
jgi:uncharacterized membrane protein